jgi:hypothetical protein
VTSVHTGHESIQRKRRKPNETIKNRQKFRRNCSDGSKPRVKIPCIINDYNNWTAAVDRSDQMIAYYRIELSCRRVWMPIIFDCVRLMRVNAYLIYKTKEGRRAEAHEEFFITFINAFNDRAAAEDLRFTRRMSQTRLVQTFTSGRKKQRMGCKNAVGHCTLPRSTGRPSTRDRNRSQEQQNNRNRSYLRAKNLLEGQARRVRRLCAAFKPVVYLCKPFRYL